MITHTVEIVATGLTAAETVDMLHDYAEAVDQLRERARLALAVIPDGHRVTRKVRAVGMLRRAPGGDRWTLAELGDAVEWALAQPADN